MATLRRTDAVNESEATGETREVFEAIQDTLRVPFVPTAFRILARGPFLAPAWRAVEPLAQTLAFEERADRLREETGRAAGPPAGPLEIDIPAEEEDYLRGFLDAHHYVQPKVLFVLELFDRIAAGRLEGDIVLPRDPLARGVARDAWSVPLVELDQASGAVRNTFKDIQRHHDHPFVADVYLGLANWPLFLQSAWGSIRPAVATDPYAALRDHIRRAAAEEVRPIDLSDAPREMTDPQVLSTARDVLEAFRKRTEPDILQDVVRLKAMLDGFQSAQHSRFSAARPGPHQPSGAKQRPTR